MDIICHSLTSSYLGQCNNEWLVASINPYEQLNKGIKEKMII